MVNSSCMAGIEGKRIEVEVDISNGLPALHLVGLPDSAVKESTERVRSAIKNSGFQFPAQRITVNLAPADMRKEGASFDLAIAVAILQASGQISPAYPEQDHAHVLWLGELSLDGTLRPVQGLIPILDSARQYGMRTIALPQSQKEECELIADLTPFPLAHLRELHPDFDHAIDSTTDDSSSAVLSPLNGNRIQDRPSDTDEMSIQSEHPESEEDFADVKGQYQAKRALMVAAAGMHNLLFSGPPGTGKTMLIRRLPTIMPDLDDEEALDVTKLYSASGKLGRIQSLLRHRPFRAPHHTITLSGLVGGGTIPKPGEVSLAHRGILYLDELPEFSRQVLEVLRQPLEEGQVTISRSRAVYTFPARFIFAASMNPCPCGYAGATDTDVVCTCSPHRVQQYRSKISGPLLDRIDIQLEIPRLRRPDMDAPTDNQRKYALSSKDMKKKVEAAMRMQQERYKTTEIRSNSQLKGKQLTALSSLEPDAWQMLDHILDSLGISLRAYDRIVRLSRTIADLDESEQVTTQHIAEAVQYRSLDRYV
ncbi:YifB family Mg chelatase-like AAA ATPase [Marinicrinis sediminis]|uniref:YifB family Mg chelatase-like AAA ATPase n=1 Tax=Marinicrinis sediminis TaxID=1652465 RepID=A0ABW5R5U3_9BACL